MAITIEGLIGGDVLGTFEGTREFTETWRYRTTGADNKPIAVHNHIPVAYGQSHPDFVQAYCLDKRARSAGTFVENGVTGIYWDVDIKWGPLEARFRDGEINPLLLPPLWSFQGENDEEIAYEDKNGDPILNPAGDYFDPSLIRPKYKGVLRCRKNMAIADVNLPALAAYSNKVNSDEIGVFAEKTLRSRAFSQPEPTYNQFYDLYYYEMTFEWDFNPDTWVAVVLSQGYRELDDNGDPVRILDKSGQDIQRPAFIDENGKKMTPPIEEVPKMEFDVDYEIAYVSTFGGFLGTDFRNL